MLNIIVGGSGVGKTSLVMAYALGDLLVLTPDKDRAKEIRKGLRAESRVKVIQVRDLVHLAKVMRGKAVREHVGPLLVDDFKQLSNLTATRLTADEDGDQTANQIHLAVYGALKRIIVGVLAQMASHTTFLTTQEEEGGPLAYISPAAGTRKSALLLVEAANIIIPLATMIRLAKMDDLYDVNDEDDDAESAVEAIKRKAAEKKAAKKAKKAKKAGKSEDKGKSDIVVEKGPPPRPKAVTYIEVDWPVPAKWAVAADLRGTHYEFRQHTGLTGLLPPYGPLLFEGLMIARPDAEALAVLHAIRSGEMRLRGCGYSRAYLNIQDQIDLWGDYVQADDI
jgi:hypothetical protein